MKLTSYIQQQLASVFGKSGLLEDLRFAHTQFKSFEEVLERADKTFGSKFKSEEAKRIQQVFSGVVKTSGGKGVFGYLANNTKNILQTIDTLEAITAGEFEERIAAKGLNYRKASLIQLVDAITFASRFTNKLLTYVAKHENAALRAEKKLPEINTDSVIPYENEWLAKGLIPFFNVVNIVSKPAASMVDRLDVIPDILADDTNYANLKSTVGEQKIDPFMFSISNFAWNPIRRVRMYQVEAKVMRQKEAESELSMTKLRLTQIERSRTGKEDPALEREIGYLQALVDDLSRELASLSEE